MAYHYGPWAGPNSRFRVVVAYSYDNYYDDTVRMWWRRYIEVDAEFVTRTVLSTSWAGNVTIGVAGVYADTGWQNLGDVSYGYWDSTYAKATYLRYNGTRYTSEGSWGESAPAPTWEPYPIEEFDASRVSDSQSKLSWRNNPHGARPYIGILVDRQIDGGSWNNIADLGGGSTSYTDYGTAPNHSYRYRVVPHNGAGSPSHSYSDTLYNTPCAPDFVSVSRKTDTTVTAVLSNDAITATSLEYQSRKQLEDGWGEWGASTSIDGTVATFDVDLGGGTFQLRARNARGDLASEWSTSDAVVTICPPAAPTLLAPASSAVVPTDQDTIAFSWSHNPIDGSKQVAAEIQLSFDKGAAWTTYSADASMTLAIPTPQKLNADVVWRVRTKGSHADFGPWSANGSFSIRQRPSVSIEEPTDGFKVENMPISVRITYIDQSGSLAQASLAVRHGSSVVYRENLGASLSCKISAAECLPEDGEEYEIEVSVRSTSSLTASTSRKVTVGFEAPQKANMAIAPDPDTGFVSVRVRLAKEADSVAANSISLFRIAMGKRTLLKEGMNDGDVAVDRFAPLNTRYVYEAVTQSESGATSRTEAVGSISTPWWFVYYDGGVARAKWEPTGSREPDRPSDELQELDGREWPLLIQGRSKSLKVKFDGWVETREEAEAFEEMALASGDKVYKGLRGDVWHCMATASITDEYDGVDDYSASVSTTITRVTGGEL